MLSRGQLAADLRAFGLARGEFVMVHASLRAIGTSTTLTVRRPRVVLSHLQAPIALTIGVPANQLNARTGGVDLGDSGLEVTGCPSATLSADERNRTSTG